MIDHRKIWERLNEDSEVQKFENVFCESGKTIYVKLNGVRD